MSSGIRQIINGNDYFFKTNEGCCNKCRMEHETDVNKTHSVDECHIQSTEVFIQKYSNIIDYFKNVPFKGFMKNIRTEKDKPVFIMINISPYIKLYIGYELVITVNNGFTRENEKFIGFEKIHNQFDFETTTRWERVFSNKIFDRNAVNITSIFDRYIKSFISKKISCPVCRTVVFKDNMLEIKGMQETCKVCMENEIELLFLECRHACICKNCINLIPCIED